MNINNIVEQARNDWVTLIRDAFSHAPFLRRKPDQYTFNVKHYSGLPCPSPQFTEMVNNSLQRADRLSLYFHFPFCGYVCTFCHYDVLRLGVDREERLSSFKNKLKEEIRATVASHPTLRTIPVSSIYFGGGTPSIQEDHDLRSLIEDINDNFNLLPNCELTLETTPNFIAKDRVNRWREMGINRISVGVEVLDNSILRNLNRQHTSEESIRGAEIVSSVFPESNVDLMYAIPGVPDYKLIDDASRMAATGINQITAYRLRLNRVDERTSALETTFLRNPDGFPSQEDACVQSIALRTHLGAMGWREEPIGWFNRSRSPECYADRWQRGAVLWGFGPSAYSYGSNWQKVNPRYTHWQQTAAPSLGANSQNWQFNNAQQLVRRLAFELRSTGSADQALWNAVTGVGEFLCSIGIARNQDARIALSPVGLTLIEEIIDQFLQ